ncbi:hypothetical protein, partial [Acinetobacter baumannii]
MMVEDLRFTIEQWDERDNLIETLARVSHLTIGFGAYEEAVKLRPGKRITLRHGAQIYRKNYEMQPYDL